MGKIKKGSGGVGSVLVVHCLSSMYKVLGSIPSTLRGRNQPCFSLAQSQTWLGRAPCGPPTKHLVLLSVNECRDQQRIKQVGEGI